MKFASTKILAAAVAVCLSGAAYANALTNGDFETGDLTGWTVTPTANGGANVQDVTMFDVDQIGGPSNAARFRVGRLSGGQGPNEGVTLSQMFNVVVAGIFNVSVDVAGHGADGENANGGDFELLIDATSLDSFAAGQVNGGQVKPDTLTGSLFLAAGAHSFSLLITRNFEFGGANARQYVDDASVLAEQAVVPLPATLPLLLIGVGGFAALARRRRASA